MKGDTFSLDYSSDGEGPMSDSMDIAMLLRITS